MNKDEIVKVLRGPWKRLIVREMLGVGHAPFIEVTPAFVDQLVQVADQVC